MHIASPRTTKAGNRRFCLGAVTVMASFDLLLPAPGWRWMFSILDVPKKFVDDMPRPPAPISPPSVMMSAVWPNNLRTMLRQRIEQTGIENREPNHRAPPTAEEAQDHSPLQGPRRSSASTAPPFPATALDEATGRTSSPNDQRLMQRLPAFFFSGNLDHQFLFSTTFQGRRCARRSSGRSERPRTAAVLGGRCLVLHFVAVRGPGRIPGPAENGGSARPGPLKRGSWLSPSDEARGCCVRGPDISYSRVSQLHAAALARMRFCRF